MGPMDKLLRATRIVDATMGLVDLLVDVEREDNEGRIDRVTVLGFIPVFDRARGVRRRARRAARQARRGRDAP